jgi:hypothetical protein
MEARYDAVADFYPEGWPDSGDDPVARALLGLCGDVAGEQILDLACGHGRIARQLADRGAIVTRIDISAALIAKGAEAERRQPAASVTCRPPRLPPTGCPALSSTPPSAASGSPTSMTWTRPRLGRPRHQGRGGHLLDLALLLPLLHRRGRTSPAPGPRRAPTTRRGWWRADGAASSLRRQVGANHRTLSTYLSARRRHGLWLDALLEPAQPPEWARARPDAARMPVFLTARCLRQ